MSDYDFVARGSLKLKKNDSLGLSEKSKKNMKAKKKKLKNSDVKGKKEMLEKIIDTATTSSSPTTTMNNDSDSNSQDIITQTDSDGKPWLTDAQKKFLAQQEKRQLERVMQKASKTHKQRVEEFNSNLEKLSEHYDIPKVSWTK